MGWHPNNKRVHSHLATLKQNTHKIIHEGIPLDNFESDYLREPSFSWNPPIRNTLTAVCKNDIDNQHDYDDSLEDAVNESIQVNGGALGNDDADMSSVHVSTNYVEGNLQVSGDRLKHYHDSDNSFDEADSNAGRVALKHVDESIQVIGDPPSCENAEANTVNQSILSVDESIQSDGIPHKIAILPGISKITELTLDQFKNNYKLFALKIS